MSKFGRITRHKWVGRFFRLLALGTVVFAIYFVVERYWARKNGENQLSGVIARLDAEEPGWRFEDIEAERGLGPEPESSGPLSARLAIQFKGADHEYFRLARHAIGIHEPINQQHSDNVAKFIEVFLQRHETAHSLAMQFVRGPEPIRRTKLPSDVVSLLLPDCSAIENANVLLGLDAERLSHLGNPNSALERIRLMIFAEQSIGSEPHRLAQDYRMACATRAAWETERVLALGTPTAGLGELQAMLVAEGDVSFALTALCGDRAFLHEMYGAIDSGTLDYIKLFAEMIERKKLRHTSHDPRLLPSSDAVLWLHKKHLPRNHAEMLSWLTEACAACRRPEIEQPAALADLRGKEPAWCRETLFCRLSTQPPDKLLEGQLRARSTLRCAAVGLAVERFRQQFQRWPR